MGKKTIANVFLPHQCMQQTWVCLWRTHFASLERGKVVQIVAMVPHLFLLSHLFRLPNLKQSTRSIKRTWCYARGCYAVLCIKSPAKALSQDKSKRLQETGQCTKGERRPGRGGGRGAAGEGAVRGGGGWAMRGVVGGRSWQELSCSVLVESSCRKDGSKE